MFLIGCGIFFVASGMIIFWAAFADGIAFKLRIEYFRKSLEKDAAFYDENIPTAMASRISKETS
jgi:hypothetical protein